MRARHTGIAALLLGWALWAPAAVRAQAPEPPVGTGGIVEEDIGEDIETLLAEAEEVFRSADQPESIPLFERVILLLEQRRAEDSLDEAGAAWLARALFRRAEARSNLLEEEQATADLTALLRLDPAWEIPEGYAVSRLLSDLLARVRDAETGVLDPLIEPADAEIYLDGELQPALLGPRRVLAGERLLRVRRPGYGQLEQPLTIPPGESVPLEVSLERTSAVVRLTARPAGVEVLYRGEVVAGGVPPEEGAEQAAVELEIEGLAPGLQTLTFRRPGYRQVEVRMEVAELVDYELDPISLERTSGTVVLSRVPAGGRVLLDGEERVRPSEPLTGVRFEMPPGSYALRVEGGAAGLFEQRFELEDRQLLDIDVRLRPGLILLGVLGGDRVAATDLEGLLAERLGGLSRWALVERAAAGFELLREAGIDRLLLRALADPTVGETPPDWAAFQGRLDQGLGGSAYLLAVLSDDLYASRADLWLWSAAPGPSRPARRRISLADAAGLEELAVALDRPLRLTAARVGARFIDSPAADAPLVLTVETPGPAAAAGLGPGDTVRSLAGEPVTTAAELTARIAALEPGRETTLQVSGPAGARSLSLTPETGLVVASLSDPSALDPALAARLASLEVNTAAETPAWLVRLNRGVVLMRSGEWRRAVEALRGIRTPVAEGVGQATVDYLLGIALLEVDRGEYLETARGLIGRAAEGRARLEHDDGPLLAPRARARLETLLGGG